MTAASGRPGPSRVTPSDIAVREERSARARGVASSRRPVLDLAAREKATESGAHAEPRHVAASGLLLGYSFLAIPRDSAASDARTRASAPSHAGSMAAAESPRLTSARR